jgi:hypothetical protein
MGSVYTILRDYFNLTALLSLDEAVDCTDECYIDGYKRNSPINQTLIIRG